MRSAGMCSPGLPRTSKSWYKTELEGWDGNVPAFFIAAPVHDVRAHDAFAPWTSHGIVSKVLPKMVGKPLQFSDLLRQVRSAPGNDALLLRFAEIALDTQNEGEAIPLIDAAARTRRTSPQFWQWSALLHRATDNRVVALEAFEQAARLAPASASIAHGHARTAWEAGIPALPLYERALRIAPLDGDILLGYAAARATEGDVEAAIGQLDDLVRQHPGWLPGHRDLAQLRWTMGDREGFVSSYERALTVAPRLGELWRGLIDSLIHAGQFERARATILRGRQLLGADVYFDVSDALVASEQGRLAVADHLFDQIAAVRDIGIAVHRTRHLLRNQRIGQAVTLIDDWLDEPASRLIWPYAATAWRAAGDPRAQWLEGHEALISTIDLTHRLPPLDKLGAVLRSLHHSRGEQFDQSVRGGTQTSGMLFARIEPELVALRATVAAAIEEHVASLPGLDARHPTLRGPRGGPARFSGSWSVWLRGQGHHTHHVHPEGWLSSALYISLPDENPADPDAGSLVLGCPPAELGLDLAPMRTIKPRPGMLALFPSTMWHGTQPFSAGERLTVAFDVSSPLQVNT
jgi:tetratricopeptide (TPR) repeat protein